MVAVEKFIVFTSAKEYWWWLHHAGVTDQGVRVWSRAGLFRAGGTAAGGANTGKTTVEES